MADDMPKLRDALRGRMRRARAPLLAALDVESIRAFEVGDNGKLPAIVARKQALRDVTRDPRIDAAKTPDQLAKIWPDILKGDAP